MAEYVIHVDPYTGAQVEDDPEYGFGADAVEIPVDRIGEVDAICAAARFRLGVLDLQEQIEREDARARRAELRAMTEEERIAEIGLEANAMFNMTETMTRLYTIEEHRLEDWRSFFRGDQLAVPVKFTHVETEIGSAEPHASPMHEDENRA